MGLAAFESSSPFETDDLLRNDGDIVYNDNNTTTDHPDGPNPPYSQDDLMATDDIASDFENDNHLEDHDGDDSYESKISSTHSSPIACPTNQTPKMGAVSKSHPAGYSFTSMTGSPLLLSHSHGVGAIRSPRSPICESIVFGSVGRTGFGLNSFRKPSRDANVPTLSSLQREVHFDSEDSPENTPMSTLTTHFNRSDILPNHQPHLDSTNHTHHIHSPLSQNKPLLYDDPLYVVTDQIDTEPLMKTSSKIPDTLKISAMGYGTIATDNDHHAIKSDNNDCSKDLIFSSKMWDEEIHGPGAGGDPESQTGNEGSIEYCHNTSYQREMIVLGRNAAPLTITFLLQYSLTVASVFSVGHLGKDELGAVSLACMTANVTGFALFQGLATCLDTMCAQAYGAGRFDLVGLYFQRCTLMILLCFIPVAFMWIFSASLLSHMIQDENLIRLAAQYLRILCFGAPGFIIFETGKRFVQAQGIFSASTFVLLICGPINAVLNYVLVWNAYIGIGYAGAPLAVAITNWLMPLFLFIYVYFIDGKKCWNGFSRAAFSNWGPMAQLAIPGVIMVEAEFLAFEVLTFVSSYFGTAALAAQSVVSTITAFTYQIPFAMAIAASTRIANFIGAESKVPASVAANTAIMASSSVAIFNTCLLFTCRNQIGKLFSNDQDVIELVSYVMPLAAFGQIFDAISAVMAGILRGQGRQYIGGYLNLFFYYAIAIPLSLLFAFTFDMGLLGLWVGIICGIGGIAGTEMYVILKTDWDQIIQESRERDSGETTDCI